MYSSRYQKQKYITPVDLNLNGVAIAAAKTSNVFDAEGFTQLMFQLNHTYNAATTISFYFESSEDNSTWLRLPCIDSVVSGTISICNGTYVILTSAAAVQTSLPMPICAKYLRIVISCDGGGTDTAIVGVRLGT